MLSSVPRHNPVLGLLRARLQVRLPPNQAFYSLQRISVYLHDNWQQASKKTGWETEVALLWMFCIANKGELIYTHSRSLSQGLVPTENNRKSSKFPYQHLDISKRGDCRASPKMNKAVPQSVHADPLSWPQSAGCKENWDLLCWQWVAIFSTWLIPNSAPSAGSNLLLSPRASTTSHAWWKHQAGSTARDKDQTKPVTQLSAGGAYWCTIDCKAHAETFPEPMLWHGHREAAVSSQEPDDY